MTPRSIGDELVVSYACALRFHWPSQIRDGKGVSDKKSHSKHQTFSCTGVHVKGWAQDYFTVRRRFNSRPRYSLLSAAVFQKLGHFDPTEWEEARVRIEAHCIFPSVGLGKGEVATESCIACSYVNFTGHKQWSSLHILVLWTHLPQQWQHTCSKWNFEDKICFGLRPVGPLAESM